VTKKVVGVFIAFALVRRFSEHFIKNHREREYGMISNAQMRL
jgi:hypothetical protein